MAILAALLGSWGRRGGYLTQYRFPLAGYPHGGALAAADTPKVDRPRGGKYPLAGEVLASGLCDATRPGQTLYDLKAWLVYGCNLVQAMPDRPQLLEADPEAGAPGGGRRAARRRSAASPTWCCPSATFLERDDDAWNGPWRRPFIAIRQAGGAAAPRLEARLVDRQGAGRQARAWATTSPGRTPTTTSRRAWR